MSSSAGPVYGVISMIKLNVRKGHINPCHALLITRVAPLVSFFVSMYRIPFFFV